MNRVDIFERTYELENKIKIRYLTYDQIKSAQLYNCYMEVILDLKLKDAYNLYRIYRRELNEQRNCNEDNQDIDD